MPNPLPTEPGGGSGSAGPETNQSDTMDTWSRSSQLSFDPNVLFNLARVFRVVSIALSDTFVTPIVDGNPHLMPESSLYCRLVTESHLFVMTQMEFDLVNSGGSAVAQAIQLQYFLDGVLFYISPSGLNNIYTFSFPAIQGETHTYTVLMGAFFNVAFLPLGAAFQSSIQKTDFHQIDLRYTVSSQAAQWTTVQMKPRMSFVYSIPSTAVNFTNVRTGVTP